LRTIVNGACSECFRRPAAFVSGRLEARPGASRVDPRLRPLRAEAGTVELVLDRGREMVESLAAFSPVSARRLAAR
jgi:hypothetical protein